MHTLFAQSDPLQPVWLSDLLPGSATTSYLQVQEREAVVVAGAADDSVQLGHSLPRCKLSTTCTSTMHTTL
jgi:hypothetical protein